MMSMVGVFHDILQLDLEVVLEIATSINLGAYPESAQLTSLHLVPDIKVQCPVIVQNICIAQAPVIVINQHRNEVGHVKAFADVRDL